MMRMSYTVKQAENENFILKIVQDDDVSSPREDFENPDTMLCWHRRYNLGDKHSYSEPREWLEETVSRMSDFTLEDVEEMEMNDLMKIVEQDYTILPLYLYDHSGITMNTTGFSCGWDSGQVGFIFISHEDAEKEGISNAEEFLKGQVESYDMYLRGEVYGFQLIEKEFDDVIDSCWGFYGLDYICEEVKSHIDNKHSELAENLSYVS